VDVAAGLSGVAVAKVREAVAEQRRTRPGRRVGEGRAMKPAEPNWAPLDHVAEVAGGAGLQLEG
jgi:hypothetical protein